MTHYGANVQLTHSFSMPSLAEGSEPISEQEELQEVKTLKRKGDESLNINEYQEALRYYEEALEIDENDVEVLMARTGVFLELGEFKKALHGTENLITLEADNAEIYKLHGLTLHKLGRSRDAVNALLTSLDLDPDNADETTDHLAQVVGSICDMKQGLTENLQDMDAYKKLSEVGVCLFRAQMFDLCIKILESAQKFQTNQKGITMRVLLTMANAHSACHHSDQAISIYQECLSTAIATHEQIYQTKALVNIATLYLENNDIHQALVYYEKLLHLESELLDEVGSEEAFPDFWTRELQCGLQLNLSIAYKSIGNMHRAVIHARKYVGLLEKFGLEGRLVGESFHNAGMLNEILGNYSEALKNYENYAKNAKHIGDKKGVAQAYGCLGSVYAALRNWKLSITYHEQYISMAKRFKDTKMLTIAHEMLGDTYILKEDFKSASKHYEAMLQAGIRTDYRTKSTALCKLGNTYKKMKQTQYSVYFYEQACDLAEDYLFSDIQTLCEFNIACQHQHSSQMMDIEVARKFFSKLIPYFETKIREHVQEGTHCPKEYHTQLSECYDGMMCVLSKLGNKEECLQYAEMYKKRSLSEKPGYTPLPSSLSIYGHSLAAADMWTVDRMNRVINQQNSVILYYCLLETHVLLWVLVPGKGVVRFYSGKSTDDSASVSEQVASAINEIKKPLDWKIMQNICENRSLPPKDSELDMVRRKNLTLGNPKTSRDSNTTLTSSATPDQSDNNQPAKSPSRKLFDILIAPIEDILMKLEPETNLIIIPDKELHHCPFGILQDWYARYFFDRFNITYMPSLLALERVNSNELTHLRSCDDLEFERAQARKGGVTKYFNHIIATTSTTPGDDASDKSVELTLNLKRVSNPRLVTSSQGKLADAQNNDLTLSRESTRLSTELSRMTPRQSTQILPGIPEYSTVETPRGTKQLPLHVLDASPRSLRPVVGAPCTTERMLNIANYSTLCTKSSTGTDITMSTQCIPEFQQISMTDKCMVFANPQLPEEGLMLHGRVWKPGCLEMVAAKKEAKAVAGYLNVDPITGNEATKQHFLETCGKATVLHIATYGCWKEGILVFSPSPVQLESGPPNEKSYLVTMEDILSLKLSAQLVVLNIGYGPNRLSETTAPGYGLPGAFLAAGAECVLVTAWPLPNDTVNKFYFHFYSCLQKGCLLTSACRSALKAVKADNRYSEEYYWSSFFLVGKNVMMDISNIRHSQLDQTLDEAERAVEEESGKEFLNPKSYLPKVMSREECLNSLQGMLGTLLLHHANQSDVVPELIDLLDSSLKRLHAEELNKLSTKLSESLTRSVGGLDMLKLIGFHFQAKGATLTRPYVVYPHWNKDELLLPTYDAVRAILEISKDKKCTQEIHDMFPITQDHISLFIDLLSITKHAPEIQLTVTDLSVKPLWTNPKVKKVLFAAGFHQIGMLLNFNRTPANKNLLTAILQLLLSVSAHKSQVLLYRLDVNLLGKHGVVKSTAQSDVGRLPSLTPLLLPRNQLRMSTPWLSRAEKPDEMKEKKKLARSKSDLEERYGEYLDRAKTWHQITVVAQANEAMSKFGRPRTSPIKVKVKAGSSASRERIPVNKEPLMMIPEIDQRRDYAQYVLSQRIGNIDLRHRNEIMKLYLPYIQSS